VRRLSLVHDLVEYGSMESRIARLQEIVALRDAFAAAGVAMRTEQCDEPEERLVWAYPADGEAVLFDAMDDALPAWRTMLAASLDWNRRFPNG
jgi:hypothetical protein